VVPDADMREALRVRIAQAWPAPGSPEQ
jgi:hypothetical protein